MKLEERKLAIFSIGSLRISTAKSGNNQMHGQRLEAQTFSVVTTNPNVKNLSSLYIEVSLIVPVQEII